MFCHERLHCYVRLKNIAHQFIQMTGKWPAGQSYLTDQLKRALSSGLLNLAEGNQRRSHKERKRFFEISTASLSESAAITDLASLLRLITKEDEISIKAELLAITKMISKLG